MLTDLDNLQNIQCLLNFSIQADYRDIKILHKNNSITRTIHMAAESGGGCDHKIKHQAFLQFLYKTQ